MNKTVQELVCKELYHTLNAKTEEELGSSLYRLAKLADIIDKSGNAKDADIIDSFIKEASLDKEAQFTGGAVMGVLVALWDWISGKKQDVIDVLLKPFLGGISGYLTNLLLDKLGDMEYVGWITKLPLFNTVVSGAVEATVAEKEEVIKDFVIKLVDNLFNKFGEIIKGKKEEQKSQPLKEQPKEEPPLAGTINEQDVEKAFQRS